MAGTPCRKLSPHDGREICRLTRSREPDVRCAVAAARGRYARWSRETPVRRGEILYAVADAMARRREELSRDRGARDGQVPASARGETDGAVALGRFMAGEGQRMYGRTTTSGLCRPLCSTVRQPIGVAGLIIAANTPIANVAWKVFPALVCGNAAVLKAAEDTPLTAWLFGCHRAGRGLPAGVLNVVQGLGAEAGEPLVAHPDVAV